MITPSRGNDPQADAVAWLLAQLADTKKLSATLTQLQTAMTNAANERKLLEAAKAEREVTDKAMAARERKIADDTQAIAAREAECGRIEDACVIATNAAQTAQGECVDKAAQLATAQAALEAATAQHAANVAEVAEQQRAAADAMERANAKFSEYNAKLSRLKELAA